MLLWRLLCVLESRNGSGRMPYIPLSAEFLDARKGDFILEIVVAELVTWSIYIVVIIMNYFNFDRFNCWAVLWLFHRQSALAVGKTTVGFSLQQSLCSYNPLYDIHLSTVSQQTEFESELRQTYIQRQQRSLESSSPIYVALSAWN